MIGGVPMKGRSLIWFVSLICVSLLFSSCAPAQSSSQASQNTTSSASPATSGTTKSDASDPSQPAAVDLMANIQAAKWSDATDKPDPFVLKSFNRFSVALLQESIKQKKTGNVMISPVSVFLALAMTLNGADGETRDAMLNVLADDGITVDMVNAASRAWISRLTKTGEKTALSIANSIWFRDGFQPYQPFLQANADFYRASARQLDFADQASADIINDWVDQETHGLIEKIIEKISPTTVMFLINTIYFKSDWQTPFEKAETRKKTFNSPSGPVDAEFMHRIAPMSYFSGDGVVGVMLPYDNGQFAYFAMLPEDSVTPREWLAAQDKAALFEKISRLMAQKANFTVQLMLPKYEAEYEDSLVDDLSTLGMDIAFGGAADFSRLNAQRAKGLYISEVKHKTFIKVDEKGTEAAAATSVAIDESLPASDIQLTFDQPFIYGIMDWETGTPLFVGILENPAA